MDHSQAPYCPNAQISKYSVYIKNSETDHIYSKSKPESLIAFDCGHKANTSKYFTPFQNSKLGVQLGMIDQIKPSQTNNEFRSLSFLFLMYIKIINATYSNTLHSTKSPGIPLQILPSPVRSLHIWASLTHTHITTFIVQPLVKLRSTVYLDRTSTHVHAIIFRCLPNSTFNHITTF